MTDWGSALVHLGYADQDFGPTPYGSYQDLASGWRGDRALPSEADLLAALEELDRPTTGDVDAERDRRIATAFEFNGVAYQLDQVSQGRVTAMGADARFAIISGAQAGDLRWADPDADFGWIATDNSVTPMDAPTMAAFADAAKLWVKRHTFAARALKAMDPIPDPTDGQYWP